MSYRDQLNDERWHAIRQVVLKRDNYTCNHCENKAAKQISRPATLVSIDLVFQSDFSMTAATRFNYKLTINDVVTKASFSTKTIVVFGLPLPDFSSAIIHYSIEFDLDGKEGAFVNFIRRSDTGNAIYVRGMQVHHSYYQEGRMAWEYPLEALETLCWMCHGKFHAIHGVPWLDKYGRVKGTAIPCERCGGTGYLPQYYYHQNGICFACDGERYIGYV